MAQDRYDATPDSGWAYLPSMEAVYSSNAYPLVRWVVLGPAVASWMKTPSKPGSVNILQNSPWEITLSMNIMATRSCWLQWLLIFVALAIIVVLAP